MQRLPMAINSRLMNGRMTSEHIIYRPLDWHLAALRDRSRVMLVTGGTGGGKSVLALQKVNAYMLRYPKAAGLFVRKTKASLANTVIDPFLEMTGDPPWLRYYSQKERIEYANGSVIYLAGMADKEQREKLKSIGKRGSLDIVFGEEATEFDESDHNMIATRMRGSAAPWQQIIYATNPDSPEHWINRRLIVGGEASVHYSVAADNQYNSAAYQDFLDTLTDVDRDRLRDGKWVMSTGLVFGVWSDQHNVSTEAVYVPDAGPVVWFVDDGYSGKKDPASGLYTANSHPRVFLIAQIRTDGRIMILAEHHAIQTLTEVHIEAVLSLSFPKPEYAIVDKSAAELRGRLHGLDIQTIGSASKVEESIKVLRGMIAADKNGWRRILVHPSCTLVRSEMLAYRRDEKEQIVKAYDHAMDALRYGAWHYRHGE